MKELNELVDQAKEISSKQWFLNADEEVTAVDNDAGPDDSEEAFIGCAANIQLAKYMATASPETILAIAEAYRALEQRAEAAESNYANEHDARKQVERNYELLEAKLTELEKHQPMAYRWESPVNGKTCYDGIKPLGVISQPLYLRPAPAINLSELVPDEMPNGGSGSPTDSVAHWCDGYNSCRAAILRKIEEQSQ